MKHILSLAFVMTLFVAGCNRGNANQCVPGATAECACMGGARGVQECLASGGFGACACPTAVPAVAASAPPAAPPTPTVPQVQMDDHAAVLSLDAASRRVSAAAAAAFSRQQANSPRGCFGECAEDIDCRNELTRRRHTEILSLETTIYSAIEVVNTGTPDSRACVLTSAMERVLVDMRAMEHMRPDSLTPCSLPAVTVPSSITDIARRLATLCPSGGGA